MIVQGYPEWALFLSCHTFGIIKATPIGFLPLADNGYLFVDVQLPDAVALERTETVSSRLEEQILQIPGVANTVLVNGFSLLNGSGSNGAMIIVNLMSWDDRTDETLSAGTILGQIYDIANREAAASIIAFNPPPIQGFGMNVGVEMEVQQTSAGTPQDLAAAVGSLVYVANQRPGIAQPYTTFRANVPQIFANRDRERANSLNVAVSEFFQTMQAQLRS